VTSRHNFKIQKEIELQETGEFRLLPCFSYYFEARWHFKCNA